MFEDGGIEDQWTIDEKEKHARAFTERLPPEHY
jgi:hypothetical protein